MATMPPAFAGLPARLPALPAVGWLALWIAAVALSAAYCGLHGLAYDHPPAPLSVALAWAVATWTGVFVALPQVIRGLSRSRAGSLWLGGLHVLAGALASILLEYVLRLLASPWGVEPIPLPAVAYRQGPAAIALGALLLWLLRSPQSSQPAARATPVAPAPAAATHPAPPSPGLDAAAAVAPAEIEAFRGAVRVPVPVARIEWVRAEENYVSLHGIGGVPPLVRSTLRAMAERLAAEDFVQIHRSVLVRREAIVARPASDRVRLRDGTVLSVGRRYRAAVAGVPAARRPIRHPES